MNQAADRALVLDFGGVISRTLFETHDVTERALGLAPGSLTWRGPFDPATDVLWRDMQADRITERDYWGARTREVGALVGESWERMETFVQRARGAEPESVIRPEAVAAIKAAQAAGCRLAVLSNELDLFYGAGFCQRLELLRRFDVVIDATYTQILKPDPRAYRACVFIDDQERNIRGAQACGWQSVPLDVRDPAAAYRQALGLLGVALPPLLAV